MHLFVRLSLIAALLAAAPATASAAVERPPAVPTATGVGGSAATVDPYATQAAIRVLKNGGNAIDATIAAAAVLGVVEPYSSGIGGGGFMVIRDRKGRVRTIDGRETAPRAFRSTSFIDPATGQPIPFGERVTSGLGVGVPGTLRTWRKALAGYGTRKLARLMRPAIRIAREGFEVDATFTQQTKDNQARFADFTSTAALYLPGGQPPAEGTTLTNPDLADTYERIAKNGVGAFYEGPIAEDVVNTVHKPPLREGATRNVRPGLMSSDDMKDYVAKWRKPTRIGWRGLSVWGMGPPSSGGSTVGEALNIMDSQGEPAADAVTEMHRYLEASKLAFADRGAYLGDPDFVDVPLRCLLSQSFADGRGSLISDTALPTPQRAGTCPAEASSAERRGGAVDDAPHRRRQARQRRLLHVHDRADGRQRHRRPRPRVPAQQRADRLRADRGPAQLPGGAQAAALEHEPDDRHPRAAQPAGAGGRLAGRRDDHHDRAPDPRRPLRARPDAAAGDRRPAGVADATVPRRTPSRRS